MYKYLLPVEEVEYFAPREKYPSLFERELDIEPIEYAILVYDASLKELKEHLYDKGFNTGFIVIEDHRGEDFSATMGIGGYFIPGWGGMVEYLDKVKKKLESKGKKRSAKAVKRIKDGLGSRYAPTYKRLHIKGWNIGEDAHIVTAHIDDPNWVAGILYPIKVLKSHRRHKSKNYKGMGNYEEGTEIFYNEVLRDVEERNPYDHFYL